MKGEEVPKMEEPQNQKVIEYEVDSTHLSRTIRHKMLFSIKNRNFIKPAFSRKSQGKLVYRIVEGNYLEFELYANTHKDYAYFAIKHLYLSQNNIDSKDLFTIEMRYSDLLDAINDINAPAVLVLFLKMTPSYHGTAKTDMIDEKYQFTEDAVQVVEAIKNYLMKNG
jgi:hypothetical protein